MHLSFELSRSTDRYHFLDFLTYVEQVGLERAGLHGLTGVFAEVVLCEIHSVRPYARLLFI